MKLAFNNSPVIASENVVSSKMGVDIQNVDLLTMYLRDKIYSDKVLAVVREYTANAIDEHRKFNIDKHVDVKLFKQDGAWIWSVRDYAQGLNEHDIRNVFGSYGSSKKRDSNEQIGGFGIGSCAGFSYTDTFYVTSYFEGVKTYYACVLSAGDSGISIGEIFKVSEEPTDESGLEVSLDVTKNNYAFFEKTSQFVRNFTNDILIKFENEYDTTNPIIIPHSPENSIQLDEYKLTAYEKLDNHYSYSNNSVIYIRMGGVIYTSKTVPGVVFKDKYVVVDVPIGKLTLPISRENIEDTPANTRVIEDIYKKIQEQMKKERETLPLPKLVDIISAKNIYDMSRQCSVTDWFQFDFHKAFPETQSILHYFSNSFYQEVPKDANGKQTIYVFPNIDKITSWKQRLWNHLTQDPNFCQKYIHVTGTLEQWEKEQNENKKVDYSDIIFVDIKKMKLPQLPKGNNTYSGSYVVYRDNDNLGYKTPDEMEAYVAKFAPLENWLDNVKSFNDLHLRTIGLVSDWGTQRGFYTVNSKKMFEAMLAKGWVSPECPAYKDKRVELEEKKRIAQLKSTAHQRVKDNFLYVELHPLVISKIAKESDEKSLNKLKEIKNKIMQENSTRGRLLCIMDSHYYGTKIERKDLRKLLKLK